VDIVVVVVVWLEASKYDEAEYEAENEAGPKCGGD